MEQWLIDAARAEVLSWNEAWTLQQALDLVSPTPEGLRPLPPELHPLAARLWLWKAEPYNRLPA